jgi:hypothetical protein
MAWSVNEWTPVPTCVECEGRGYTVRLTHCVDCDPDKGCSPRCPEQDRETCECTMDVRDLLRVRWKGRQYAQGL